MVFSSLVFLCIFLPIVFGLYCLIPSMKVRNGLLIMASLLFYAYGEPIYILLMLVSTIANYLFALGIEKSSRHKKSILGIAVFLNLATLGVFKYTDMILQGVGGLLHHPMATLGIALPIGISFYTFQAMSYVIDVYRGQVKAQKNYFYVLLYISFFPQLIAGPIVKYRDIEHQIGSHEFSMEEAAKGLRRFIFGLSKKVLLANVLAIAVDQVFAKDLSQINICSAWLSGIAYMLQIYFDFSGYSDMAIGLGRMFGFTFLENFNYPYASTSIQEFWRRWHISLSTWFKEYLYIPLGGNRKGRVRTWLNRLTVFFFTGLWHGANWTFVLWGLYHGFFLFLEDVSKKYVEGKEKSVVRSFVSHIYVFVVVCIGFVMFRADTVEYGMGMIGKMFTGWNFQFALMQTALQQCNPLFLFMLILGFILQFPVVKKVVEFIKYKTTHYQMLDGLSYVVAFLLLLLCMLSLSSGTYNPFIYFRF